MALTYTWIEIAQAVADKVFGYSMFNNMRNNGLALKERFEVEHNWSDGTHKKPGVYAGCVLDGAGASNPTIATGSDINVDTPVRASTGTWYVNVTDTSGISSTTPVVLSTPNTNSFITTTSSYDSGTGRLYVYIWSSSHVLADTSAPITVTLFV